MEQGKAQNDAGPGTSTEDEFRYVAPRWFLDNIKTAEELKKAQARIWLVDEGTEAVEGSSVTEATPDEKFLPEAAGDGRDTYFTVGREVVEDLLDTAASLQMVNLAGRLPRTQSSITLSCEMRFGLQFLDELVIFMAKELESSLVSINVQDLEDVGLDFYCQKKAFERIRYQKEDQTGDGSANINDDDNELGDSDDDSDASAGSYDTSSIAQKAAQRYFGVWSDSLTEAEKKRSNDALSALLDAVEKKGKAPNGHREDGEGFVPHHTPQPPLNGSVSKPGSTILYLRDGLESLEPSEHGHQTWGCRLQDAVNQLRKGGEKVIIVMAATHTDADEHGIDSHPDIPWKISSCHCHRLSKDGRYVEIRDSRPGTTIPLMPLNVPRGWLDERKSEWEGSIAATRIQSFKRRLKAQLAQYPSMPPDLLEPQHDWFSLLPERVASEFASVHFKESVNVAFNRLLSRCSRKQKVDSSDVRAILLRINGSDTSITGEDGDSEGNSDKCDDESSEDNNESSESSWEEKLRQLSGLYTTSCMANPLLDDLDAQLDNVVLDQDVMTSITTIIQQQQHQPDIGAASSGIMDLVKIRGILLYGPPGTGKTLLARVIAKSTGHIMIAVDPATIRTCLVGTTEKRIRAAFTLAQKLFPCIIFIDELDSLFLRRTSNDRPWERASVIQFLQSMDGLVQDKRAPLVIGATNKPMDLDSAFLRRLPHKVSLGLPDAKARTRILLLLLEGVNLDHVNIDHLAAVTEGFSGADLKTLCSQAALDWAVQKNMESGQPSSELEARLTDEHFSKAFGKIKPGTSQKDLALLEEFTKRFGPVTRASSNQAHSDSPVEKNYYKVADAWTNFPEKARKVIRWIDSQEPNGESSPYFWEKKLLPLLVDPHTIGACWSDLAIHPKTEQEIKEILNHHSNSCESTQSYGLLRGSHTGGALVYGPPGTGKTQLARVLAHESGTVVICATPADLVSKHWGEGPKAIKGLFNLGRLLAPSIIFIDEAESMFPARELMQRQRELADINQLLHEMDGLTKSKDTPFVLIATNLPGRLDTAVLRRVPSKFYLGLPTTEIRAKVFAAVLKEEILHSSVNVYQLALLTPGLTGSDIRTLCVQTAIICDKIVEEGDNKGKRLLTRDHFAEALSRMSPTFTKEALSAIRNFAEASHPVGLEQMEAWEADALRVQEFWATRKTDSGVSGESHTADFPNNENTSNPLFDEGPPDSSGGPVSIINPPAGCLEKIRRCANYTPLPTPTSIRLVKLYNFTGSKPWSMHEPIRCSIVLADLADTPEYFALSYTWGDPRTIYTEKNDVLSAEAWASPAFEIDCDGHAVSVATNLYTALVSIRGKFSERKFIKPISEDQFRPNNANYSYIWIDALCINQDDLQEKANQIPLMNRIYSQARATIMWLGGEEPLIKRGVPETMDKLQLVVNRLREEIGPENEDLVIDWCRTFDIYDPDAYEVLGLEPIDLVDLVGWYLLFSRSWFKRAWVVQEWVLSPTCFFLCGTLTFSTEAFCSMFIDFSRRHWTLQIQKLVIANLLDPETMAIPHGLEQFNTDHRDFPLESKYRTLPLFRAKLDYSIFDELDESLLAVYILRDFFTDERSKTPPRDPSSQELWNIGMSIQLFRGRRCFNPRDKIYAFHGIFKNSDGMSIFPSPDYLKSVSEVYAEATRAIALEIGISFLHFREFRSSNPHGLPSWVPDYQVHDGFLKLDNPFTPTKHPSSFFKAASGLGTSTL
ncbi:Cell division control protein 48 [Colletotrichum gloeosporioides]|uniref:Cell division control protein 48 n=1 Tax=Colletotrichum gloeosporioides TaxID=474922 RepID=A0A8H4CCP5_COLGL|nr:Cell division control protein 48 [Colletotrichum gloeosporioides]KAF3801346.1 Cell division control protein 48 [Colletotrichum gloeosporioides]